MAKFSFRNEDVWGTGPRGEIPKRQDTSKTPLVITLYSSSNLVHGFYFQPNDHGNCYNIYILQHKAKGEFSQVSPPVSGCLRSRLHDWQVEDLDWPLFDRSIFSVDSKLLTTALKQMGAITNISQFSSSCSVWVNSAVIHGGRDREIRNTIAPNLNLSRALCRGPARSGDVCQVSHEPGLALKSTLHALDSLWAPQISSPILAPNQ